MQAFKLVLVVACLTGIASAASWPAKLSCEDCKRMVKMLQENPALVEEALIQQCRLTDYETDKCIAGVKEQLDQFLKLSPEEMCQGMRYCPREMPLFGLLPRERSKTSLFCEPCKQGVNELKNDLDAIEILMIIGCLKEVDEGKQKKCTAAVKSYIDYLSKESSEKICQDLDLCSPKMRPSGLVRQERLKTSLLCEPCKLIAEQVKAGAPNAQERLKKLCKTCGAPENVKKCEQAIDNFVKHIEEMSPQELCTEIGLCKED